MSHTLKTGDIIKTGTVSNSRSFRITAKATPDDLRYINKVRSYLVVKTGQKDPRFCHDADDPEADYSGKNGQDRIVG